LCSSRRRDQSGDGETSPLAVLLFKVARNGWEE
jgi:hypothetical protein